MELQLEAEKMQDIKIQVSKQIEELKLSCRKQALEEVELLSKRERERSTPGTLHAGVEKKKARKDGRNVQSAYNSRHFQRAYIHRLEALVDQKDKQLLDVKRKYANTNKEREFLKDSILSLRGQLLDIMISQMNTSQVDENQCNNFMSSAWHATAPANVFEILDSNADPRFDLEMSSNSLVGDDSFSSIELPVYSNGPELDSLISPVSIMADSPRTAQAQSMWIETDEGNVAELACRKELFTQIFPADGSYAPDVCCVSGDSFDPFQPFADEVDTCVEEKESADKLASSLLDSDLRDWSQYVPSKNFNVLFSGSLA